MQEEERQGGRGGGGRGKETVAQEASMKNGKWELAQGH